MTVNTEISTVEFDTFTFWKDGSISTKLLCLFKELVTEMLISNRAKVEIFILAYKYTHLRTLLPQGNARSWPGRSSPENRRKSICKALHCNYASQSRTAAKQHSSLIICQSAGPLFDNVS